MSSALRTLLSIVAAVLFTIVVLGAASSAFGQTIVKDTGVVIHSPAMVITTGTADSATTPSTSAHEAVVQFKFGTVTGTYTTCTAQAKTSIDGGATFLTIGAAQALTVTTNTVNAWTLIEQLGTTSVTSGAVSSTASLSFGLVTKVTFACSGAYGSTAPVTISVIYKP